MDEDEDLKKIEQIGKKAGEDAARKIGKKTAKSIGAVIKKLISLCIKIFGKYLLIIILVALIVAAIWYAVTKENINEVVDSSRSSIDEALSEATGADNEEDRR